MAHEALGFAAEDCLCQFIFGVLQLNNQVWAEMSATDRRVLSAMTHVPGGEVKKIRDELNMETNQFNPYRMRLIRKGVVDGTCYGKLRFTLPLFEDYIRENGYMENVG